MALRKVLAWVLAAGLAMVLLAGCGGAGPAPHAGFLSHYDQMKTDPGDESLRYWEKPGVDWTRYKKLMIDPVKVLVDEKKAERPLKPGEAAKLAGDFRKTVIQELKGSYPVVSHPAKDVLEVQAAITRVVPVNPAANIASATMVMMPVSLGQAAIEVRFVDSTTGELLAELTDYKQHGALTLNMGWREWSHVEDLFQEWADMLKTAMKGEK